jgi:hypothetical protein
MHIHPLGLSSVRPMRAKTSEILVEGLYEISKALVNSAPPGSLEAVLNVMSTFLELRAASLSMFQADGTIDVVLNAAADGSAPVLVPLSRGAARRVGATGMALIVESVSVELSDLGDAVCSFWDNDLDASLVCVPVKDDVQTIGSLTIVREHSPGDQADFCFDTDIGFLRSVANLVGLALRVSRLAEHDGADKSSGPPRRLRGSRRPPTRGSILERPLSAWPLAGELRCGRLTSRRERMPPCCCAVRPASEKTSLRARCTMHRTAASAPSSC